MNDKLKPVDVSLPPPLNATFCAFLMQRTQAHIMACVEINRYIRDEYPQFNEKSKIQELTDPTITIRYLLLDYGVKLPLTAIKTYRKGVVGALWRILGGLFSRREWERRGIDITFVPNLDRSFERTVQMKTYGYGGARYSPQFNDILGRTYMPSFSIEVGYEPLTDTLYIHPNVIVDSKYHGL